MEPLTQLKDIHLPEQIQNYPLALGWWLLATFVIAFLTFILIKLKKTQQLHRAKKQAIKKMNNQASCNNDRLIILKWAALQYFPRVNVANLYGSLFCEFLINSLPKKYQAEFSTLCSDSFEKIYRPSPVSLKAQDEQSEQDFHQAIILWLKHALPPKILPINIQDTDHQVIQSEQIDGNDVKRIEQ